MAASQNIFSLLVEEGSAQAPSKKNKRKKKPAVSPAEESQSGKEAVSRSAAAKQDAGPSLEGFQQVCATVGQGQYASRCLPICIG